MTQSVENSPQKSPVAAWTLAIVATLGMSVSYVDRQTLAAIAPSVTDALQIDNTHLGWLLSAFSLAYLVGAPLAGALVDRLGARRGFALAVLVWSIVAGFHAFAFSFGMLFMLRVFLGAAEAPSFPSAAQAMRRALPGARRPLAFGLLFTGSSLGAIIAGKLAVGLDTKYGFRAAFVLVAVIGMAWLPIWLVVSRGFGLDRGARAALPAVEDPPVRAFDVIRTPAVVRAIVAIVGSAPAMMFVLNWTSKYLVDGWHLPKSDIGNYLVAAPLLFDVGAVAFGAIASARAEPDGGRTHNDLFIVALLLQASVALAPLAPSPLSAIAICAASACGGGGIYVLVTSDMLSRVPVERTSVAGGMTAAAQSLAHVVVGPLIGWSVDRTHSYTSALIGLGVVIPPAMIAFLAWPGIKKK